MLAVGFFVIFGSDCLSTEHCRRADSHQGAPHTYRFERMANLATCSRYPSPHSWLRCHALTLTRLKNLFLMPQNSLVNKIGFFFSLPKLWASYYSLYLQGNGMITTLHTTMLSKLHTICTTYSICVNKQ